jgi:hypothetical protein
MVGDPQQSTHFRMAWCQALNEEIANRTPGKFTLIKDNAAAVKMFRKLCDSGHFPDLSDLRGKNLACWCKQGIPCHADVLLELANP